MRMNLENPRAIAVAAVHGNFCRALAIASVWSAEAWGDHPDRIQRGEQSFDRFYGEQAFWLGAMFTCVSSLLGVPLILINLWLERPPRIDWILTTAASGFALAPLSCGYLIYLRTKHTNPRGRRSGSKGVLLRLTSEKAASSRLSLLGWGIAYCVAAAVVSTGVFSK